MNRRNLGLTTVFVCLVVCVISHCGDGPGSSDTCRLFPDRCFGGAGTLCSDDRDCDFDLYCCKDKSNCGGGMCTFACDDDRECPFDMLCEHDKCFYRCDNDRDCADGMSCEHGDTICEYP